jgi:hypothetical protein
MRPAPLPAPIVFDGPARPRVRPVVLHNQHKQPTSSSHKGSCAPILRSEPVLTMFDGPARSIRQTHSQHRSAKNSVSSSGSKESSVSDSSMYRVVKTSVF